MKIKQTLRAELDKRELHPYIKSAWEVIEPGIDYIDNWHIQAI